MLGFQHWKYQKAFGGHQLAATRGRFSAGRGEEEEGHAGKWEGKGKGKDWPPKGRPRSATVPILPFHVPLDQLRYVRMTEEYATVHSGTLQSALYSPADIVKTRGR